MNTFDNDAHEDNYGVVKLTMTQATAIISFIQKYDSKATMRTDYSGRFMYGLQCLGYVTSNPNIVGVAFTLTLKDAFADDDVLATLTSRGVWDDMGLNTIVYYPGITVE